MAIKHTYYKNRIPNLWEIKKLNKELLDLVGGMKYKNACKFLMLVKMYNNRNVKCYSMRVSTVRVINI